MGWAFSNGIVTLTVLAVLLLLATGASVHALVPLYAMGVFTGFAMAGYGMAKHHLTKRERGWRHKLVTNLAAGITSTIVVMIFVVTKFTEGAWLIVVVFPVLVFTFIRLNNRYRAEAAILDVPAPAIQGRPGMRATTCSFVSTRSTLRCLKRCATGRACGPTS